MKHITYKTILLFCFTLLAAGQTFYAQCPFPAFGFGLGSAPPPGNSTIIETCNFVGEYDEATGCVNGNDYTVNYSGGAGTYVIVYDNSFNQVASGVGTAAFTATYNGTYYSASFVNAACALDPFFTCNISLWSNVTPLPPPANDNPCSATTLLANASCIFTTSTNDNATASPGVPVPGCAGYLGGDVWFTATIPASGKLRINTDTGVMLDGGMAIYTGTCGALTLHACDDDSIPNGAMPMILLTTLPPGTVIFIRIWEVGNNNNGTFDICAEEIAQCGTPLNNDYCASPAQLTQGPGSWSSSTSAIYSADIPGNLAMVFCGSIENNSWYQFTALNTTESFNFVSITGCVAGFGIQAAVYQIVPDINGCCDVLTLVSNCFSPSTPALGTVTAPGLTIGNSYVLMVDGFSGDDCDFTVVNWTAVGILPVELVDFHGLAMSGKNAIRWETASEKDNDYFNVLRSFDGVHFETIGTVNGVGNAQSTNYYNFDDFETRTGMVYYRLDQVDVDGHHELSEIIALDRKASKSGLIAVYPNPTTGKIVAEINGTGGTNGTITISNLYGEVLISDIIYSEDIQKHTFDLESFDSGVYIVEYRDEKTSSTTKFIKN